MAKIEYDGTELDVAEDWRIGELIEAENALGMEMAKARTGAQMALIMYITIRRHDKSTPTGMLADRVMLMEITKFSGEEDDEGQEVPLDETEHRSEIDEQPTSGLPHSEVSA